LTVFLEYKEGDLYGLIEEAKAKAREGESSIEVQGYYQVQERQIEEN
jgi:hypothetical protein